MTSPYYKLPEVDKNTYLMNGKNVVMSGDRGKAIGVVDLVLEVNGDSVKIANRESNLRMVTQKNTNEDKVIASMFGEWEDQLLHYATDILAELTPGTTIQNYFGLLADNAAIQLLNDSKIHYALNRIKANEKKYIDYPIIAASTYESFGVKSTDDFINIHDKITESDLTTLQNYNSYLYVYTITGAQLKEWLEWSASAYETTVRNSSWQDDTISSLMKETKLKSLISEDWLNDWSNFYVFDGISYKIDPSSNPRYDLSGNRISSNERVTNVYYQGKEVTDDMELLIATNKITKPTEANKGVENQAVLKGYVRSQSILGKYINQLSTSGSIIPHVDNNWSLVLPNSYQFIVKTPNYANTLFEKTPWYVKQLSQKDGYRYYAASYPNTHEDNTAPHIVVAPLITNPTASSFEIAAQAVDDSEIKYFKFMNGEHDINYNAWIVAKDIPSKGFTVWKNGMYTIFAEDIYGNKSVKQLVVENFDDNLLPRPVVDNYTNRKSKISGKAEPNTILVIETPNRIYEQKINANGTFSIALPGQIAETYITVYVKDDERELESERVEVRINRTGPNQPLINPMYNNVAYLTGNARENTTSIIAIIDDVAYVSDKGGRELFEANKEIYDPLLEIVETLVDVSYDGQFVIMLPPQDEGTSIKIYAMDHVSRNSRVSTITVKEAAPNAPVINEVSNIERTITGFVPDSSNTNVQLYLSDRIYTTKTDKEGRFSFTFNKQLYAGQSFVVIASDMKDKRERLSYPVEAIVNDIEAYVKPNSTNLVLNRVTDKANLITGFYHAGGTVNIAITKGKGKDFTSNLYSASTDFDFRFQHYLDEKLEIGTKVYAMVRFVDGRILLAQSFTVTAGRPNMPELLKEITNNDKEVKVVAIKDTEIVLTIGKKLYSTSEYVYDEATDQYIYTLATDRNVSGTSVTVTATNESGTSDDLLSQLVKASPDSPTVDTVYAGDKAITGSIELLDYVPAEGPENEEKLPKEFKNAPSEVAKTQTKVYAQIGTKTYKGTIDNKGNFTIDIPEQIEGIPIKLWGTNKAGRGPLIKIIVTKK
jgi:2',3'-cyclic-nucleotide 2'-phosphodiesterase/3'-nucleotidase